MLERDPTLIRIEAPGKAEDGTPSRVSLDVLGHSGSARASALPWEVGTLIWSGVVLALRILSVSKGCSLSHVLLEGLSLQLT